MSDHLAQFISLTVSAESPEIKKIIRRKAATREDINSMKNKFSEVCWDSFFHGKGAQESYSAFHEYFLHIVDHQIPLKEKKLGKRNSKKHIWSNDRIIEMKKTLDALDTIAKVKKDPESLSSYKSFRKIYTEEINRVVREKMRNT